ncbi:MAG: hypothetical protein U0869_19995 [Chloroflexota bacterium]
MLYPKEMLRDTIFGVLLILSFAAPARRRAGEERPARRHRCARRGSA